MQVPEQVSDILGRLEPLAGQPEFKQQWRRLLRAISLLVVSDLPPEASQWIRTADEFEANLLSEAQLNEARVRAIRFYEGLRRTPATVKLAKLSMVMHRLWPGNDDAHWYDRSLDLRDNWYDAGLDESDLWAILCQFFPELPPPPAR